MKMSIHINKQANAAKLQKAYLEISGETGDLFDFEKGV